MKRELYSRELNCTGNCLYCFAKWGNYRQPVWGANQHCISDGEAIIYPCCDGEFVQQKIDMSDLYQECKYGKNYISISTKQDISDDQLKQFEEVNNKLFEQNRGFVKIGVSFTTKHRIKEIERGTLAYEARVHLLHRIMDKNLNTCVIFKPVLPFIPTEEYFEMAEELKFARKFLLGDLYIDKTTGFYNEYIAPDMFTEKRQIGWLDGSIEWDVLEQKRKKDDIKNKIRETGCEAYDSDVEIIRSFIPAGNEPNTV